MYTYLEAGEAADLDLRYSVLCQAALAAPVLLERQAAEAASGSAGGSSGAAAQPARHAGEQQRIVYVANDWPTALLLLRLQYSVRALGSAADQGERAPRSSSSTAVMDVGSLQRLLAQRLGASAAAAFCIHNLAYQGVLGADTFTRLSLPAAALPALCTSSDWRDVLHELEQGIGGSSGSPDAQQQQQQAAGEGQACPAPGATTEAAAAAASATTGADPAAEAAAACSSGELNQMRSALLAADCLVTVSPGYAVEVQQEGPFGCGLHDILAARGIRCDAPAMCLRCARCSGRGQPVQLPAAPEQQRLPQAGDLGPSASFAAPPTLALPCYATWLQRHHERRGHRGVGPSGRLLAARGGAVHR